MALGRISGPLLKADLLREGVDLAVETNLIYFEVNTHASDVANNNPLTGRVGIKTDTPAYDLEVNGTLKATVYRMDELNIGNGVLTGNVVVTDGYFKTLIGDLHLQAEPITGKVILDSNTKINGDLEVTGDITLTNVLIGGLTSGRVVLVGNDGQLVDDANLTYDSNKLTVTGDQLITGNLDVDGNITLGGTINIGNFNDDLVVFNGEIGSDFIPDVTDTYDIGTALKRWDNGYYKTGYLGNLSVSANTIQSTDTNGSVTISPNGSGTVSIAGTTALRIPSGSEADKSGFTSATGQIRLNTTTSQFEGYTGSNWSSLGGVRSVDNLTYITAELTPGASDDTIRFYTNGTLRGSVDSAGLALNAAETITFKDLDDNAYVSVRAPDQVDESYIIKLPAAQPFNRSVLSNDGIGNTEWVGTDTFGGNRVYVSAVKGSDTNDGVNAPVASIKRGLQIASSISIVPTVTPTAGTVNASRLLEDNRLYIQSEVIGFIESTYNTPPGTFVYDSIKCKRDVGFIVDAVIYDITYGGNRRSVEAGQSYLTVAPVVGPQKTQTLAAINKARDIAIAVIQNLTPGTTYQNIVLQVTHPTVPGTTAVSDVTAKFNTVYSILNTGSSPTIVEPSFTRVPVTVYVASADYYIDNPVVLGDNVSVVGDSLRSVIIRPLNANKDMFRVRNGAYMNNITFRDGLNVSGVPSYTFAWAVAFDDPLDVSVDRVGYTGLSNTKPLITLSPYIQNCSIISFLGGNGVLVDGSKVVTPNVPANTIEAENPINLTDGVPEQGKSMVGNAFTMLSFGGTGWLITNDAYAQLVSCFQIFMLNGTYTQSGGYISITNSATNFGLYALRSSGYSPNSFTFDRGTIAATGTSAGSITLTSIGTKRAPVSQYVIRIKNAITGVDITSNFKEASVEKTFNAATDVNATTNEITIVNHSFTNTQPVYYSNNGNADITGLLDNGIYYIQIVNSDKFILYNDNSLTYQADIQAVGSGTHKIIANNEEFFVGDTISSHSSYQELGLPAGPSYSFTTGQTLLGLTAGITNTAFVHSWNPTTRKLILSIEYTVIEGNLQRIFFDSTSTIVEVGGLTVSYDVDNAVQINGVYFTSVFKATSTISGNQLLDSSNTLLQNINFHRPSIVNSSAHTWEFAGSGTDYNALPQNGGVGGGITYEQYSELPGRVYSSGTNELGDFKVGDFIIAENKTGNITFKTQVTIGELSVLKLSLSDVEVSQFSTDPGLGDNEPGGASNSRISVQRAVRTFIANRLGNVLDKDVSTNAVPGAVVQLNSQGQINQDLLPPARGVTTYQVFGWGNRIYLANQIPAIEVISGDNASETYTQRALTISAPITWSQGDIITQVGTTGYGVVKQDYVANDEIILVNSAGTWNTTNDLIRNSVTLTGTTITVVGEQVTIVDNYYLKKDTSSQYLILAPGTTYDFTGITTVTGANSAAQGDITSGPVYGVAYQLDTTGLFGGSGYTPASGTASYSDVPLTNITSSGINATANITVTNGAVTSAELVIGGTGYEVGDILSASSASIGGTGSGFYIPVLRADTRLYINLVGNFIKFTGSIAAPEYIEDSTAATVSIPNLAAVSQDNFDARDISVGGAVNYALSNIVITSHGYSDGDPVVYANGGNATIGNLVNGRTYWVKVVDPDTFEIYNNYGFTSGSKVLFGTSSSGTHNFKLFTIGTTNSFIYAPAHGLITAQPIRFSATTPPTGLSNNAYYFVGSVTVNSFTLHTNRSDAAASENGITALSVTLSSTGSGSATITTQNIQIIGTLNTSSTLIDNWGQIAQSTIDASNIVSGVIGPTRLGGTGSATNKTFLRGDSSWEYAVQNIRTATNSPLSITGDYFSFALVDYYYNALTFDIARADEAGGDATYTSLGVAAFNKSQFNVNSSGQATIKNGVVDAGSLDGQDGTYYTNPANIVGQVSVGKGGTGLSSVTKGDILYSGANNSLTQLAIGPANSILTSDGLIPSWSSTLSLNSGVVSANTSTAAFRITQTGTGDALLVEDSANVDSTPFVIKSDGKVGISTTDPVAPLHLAYTTGTPAAALLTTDAAIITAEDTAPGFAFVVAGNTSAGQRGVFKSTRSRGTLAAPTVPLLDDNTFSLLGAIYDSSTTLATAAINFDVDGAVSAGVAPQRISFWTGTTNTRTEKVRIANNGFVGINTTDPQRRLTIKEDSAGTITTVALYNADTTDNNGTVISFRSDTTGAGATTFKEFAGFSTRYTSHNHATRNSEFRIFTDSASTDTTTKLIVLGTGNVGIGTETPGYKLEVNGTGFFASTLTVNGDLIVNGSTTTVNSTTITVDDKNIELGAVVAIGSVTGTITGTATTTTVTGMTTTSGMIPGQVVTKVSGGGVFGGATTITSVDSATQITITSTTANTTGTLTFSVGGATDVTANGGGITLKGTSDKTFIFNNANSRWETNIGLSVDGALNVTGNVTLGSDNTDTITTNGYFVTGTQLKTAKTATNILALSAYDVDGAAYTNLITLTASNTPTVAITSTGIGTIDNITIGGTTRAAGNFTTLDANSTVGLSPANANVTISPTGTGTVTINPAGAISITGSSTLTLGTAGQTTTMNGNISATAANQTVTLSPTGTGTVTINPAGAISITGSSTLTLGTSGQTTTLNGTTITMSNATNVNVNGANPTIATTSTGTLTLFNASIATATLFNSATTATLLNAATSLGIGNTATAAQTVNMFTASTGASTYNIATGPTVAATKIINIGTNGTGNSVTNIAFGSTVSGAQGTTSIGGSVLTVSTPTTISLGTNNTLATTVTVGGAITGNILKIASTSAGTINLTTDVTTGFVSVFPSLTTGTVAIGSAAAGTVSIAFNKASTSTTTGALTVAGGVGINGALNALTKSFVIPHPTKKGKLLRHGSLEGPEFGVYVRGRCTSSVIELPDYWTGLVDEDTITVDLTPIGKHQKLYVERIEGNKVYIANDAVFGKAVNCFYTVWGERKDVDSLDVEVNE